MRSGASLIKALLPLRWTTARPCCSLLLATATLCFLLQSGITLWACCQSLMASFQIIFQTCHKASWLQIRGTRGNHGVATFNSQGAVISNLTLCVTFGAYNWPWWAAAKVQLGVCLCRYTSGLFAFLDASSKASTYAVGSQS